MMPANKAYRYLVNFFAVLGVVFCVLMAGAFWAQTHTLSPSLERQSTFYKNYNPTDAVKNFQSPQYGAQMSGPSSSGSGIRFTTNDKWFQSYFVMQNGQGPALMNAVKEDINAQLLRTDARVLTHPSDAASRPSFHLCAGAKCGSRFNLPDCRFEGTS